MKEEQQNIPEIRFKEFAGNKANAWEQRRLSECFDERNNRSKNGELISVTINEGIKKARDLDRKDNSSRNKSNYKVVEVGDIAYNSMRMWQGASGYSPYKGIVSPAYTVLAPKKGIDSKFFASYFKRSDIIWIFRINSQGLTSDTWNLKYPALSKISVRVPSYEEQQKISTFFEKLDSLITLQQRKLEQLQTLKKTMLSKLFPKNDEKYPEIRFKNFTDAWELHKLGELISKEIKGKAKATMIGGENFYLETSYLNGNNPTFVDSPKDVEKDDVLILWDGSQAGKVYHGFEGALGSTLKAYRPKESGEFIYQYLNKNQERIYASYRTPNIPHVVKNFKDEFVISNPALEEQQKIGKTFKLLDSLITLHQRKLEELEMMKKTLLRQMLV